MKRITHGEIARQVREVRPDGAVDDVHIALEEFTELRWITVQETARQYPIKPLVPRRSAPR